MSKNVRHPHISPFTVDEMIADDNARFALPWRARGYPSSIVVAAELAPGIFNNTLAYESPVVDAATSAIQNSTARYGSGKKCKNENVITRPVVTPAVGIIPINKP